VVSPAQDHLRRSFHYRERSWGAALISLGQLLAVIGLSVGSAVRGLPLARLPLTILLAANGFSLLLGLVLARDRAFKQQIPVDGSVRSRQILISSLAIVGAGLVSTVIMSVLVGPDLVGYAEAARTAAQPVLVVTFGLTAALSSRALSAVHERDHARARDVNRLFIILLGVTTVAFFLLFVIPPSLELIGALLPAAVAIPGLALVSITGNLFLGLTYFWREQIINGGKEKPMAEVDVWSVSVPVAAALASPWLGAFARGIGVVGQNIYRALYYRRLRRHIYGDETIGFDYSVNLPG
jgi:Na+-driven multidrug efflux pump